MTDWPLIIGLLGFLFGVLSAVGTYMFRAGGHAQKILSLEMGKQKTDADIEAMKTQLARGDTRFATLTEKISGMDEKLDDLKGLLTEGTPRRKRGQDEN